MSNYEVYLIEQGEQRACGVKVQAADLWNCRGAGARLVLPGVRLR